MRERLRPLFWATFVLTGVWFVLILLCLPSASPPAADRTSGEHAGPDWASPFAAPQAAPLRTAFDSHMNNQNRQHHTHDHNNNNNYQDATSHQHQRHRQHAASYTPSTQYCLFHEFKPTKQSYDFATDGQMVTKQRHKELSSSLVAINDPLDEQVRQQGYKLFAFNLLASNRAGLIRPLPDTRPEKCPRNFEHQLSSQEDTSWTASVVICYYNEAPSALLRTIYTVLERSPPHLLEEIIVIDDSSEPEFHIDRIKPFVDDPRVSSIRTQERMGLIRARLFGSQMASAPVLIFLDSHVEANQGWLEPLMETVKQNSTTIACPMIDLINADTLLYTSSPMVRGGLGWNLQFRWDSVPGELLKTRQDFAKAIESPTMAGGLYAIRRDYFRQLGQYDQGMDLWGGENIELSLRAWMCGGSIVILPCSRLGHIFRKRRPYGPPPDQPDSLLKNSHRTALVWLDEYLERFYEAQPEARQLKELHNDVSARHELRKQLKCHSFSWYLDNVYPHLKQELLDSTGESELSNSHHVHQSNNMNTAHDRHGELAGRNLFDTASNKKHRHRSELGGIKRRRDTHSSQPLGPAAPQPHNQPHRHRHHQQHLMHQHQMHQHHQQQQQQEQHEPQLPPAQTVASFQIKAANSHQCVMARDAFLTRGFTRLVLAQCLEPHEAGFESQVWLETELHDLRLASNRCLDLLRNLPVLRTCYNTGSLQAWRLVTVGSSPGVGRARREPQISDATTTTTTTMSTNSNISAKATAEAAPEVEAVAVSATTSSTASPTTTTTTTTTVTTTAINSSNITVAAQVGSAANTHTSLGPLVNATASSSPPDRQVIIYSPQANLCLAVERVRHGEPVIVTICDASDNARHARQAPTGAPSNRQPSNRPPGWRTATSWTGGHTFRLDQSILPSQRWQLVIRNSAPVAQQIIPSSGPTQSTK